MELAASLSPRDGLVLGELGMVLIALGIAAYIASKIRLSVVPIFLFAGLAFGDGGVIALDLSDEFLDLGAQWGAILLLLFLGLEYSSQELFASVKTRRSLGAIDLVLNFLPGALFAILLGWGALGALTLGGITYVSSSGIASQFIKDSRLETMQSTKRAISVLVIEDLFLAPYLPVLSALLAALGFLSGLISISVALVITGIVLLIGARGIQVPHGPHVMGDSATLLLTVFGSALLASGVATYFGFSGAVAAFLVGLLLTGDVAIVARIRLAPLRDLFSAIFFLFFGLSTNPADIPGVLLPAILLTIVGVLSKLATAWWAVKDLDEVGATWRTAALLIPRGEFSMVIAGLAATTVFAIELQALTLTYVILTTLISSLISRATKSNNP
ncbi:MAG: cation:proton antiporter [Actinobacteria bacterium]|nr:cation:proton antiporter [Actinomycetota bacterium]